VHYVEMPVAPAKMVGLGDVDFGMSMAPSIIFHQDAGLPIMTLAGMHPGCWELFAHPTIRTIGDLKGKTVDVPDGLGSSAHLFMAIMAKHVGLDLGKDIKLVTNPAPDAMAIFAQGNTDAILASPPRARICMPGRLAG
jgi:NitT/TauT family transport system substrate-binding protein